MSILTACPESMPGRVSNSDSVESLEHCIISKERCLMGIAYFFGGLDRMIHSLCQSDHFHLFSDQRLFHSVRSVGNTHRVIHPCIVPKQNKRVLFIIFIVLSSFPFHFLWLQSESSKRSHEILRHLKTEPYNWFF